jgi:hypothetical protein
MFRCRRVNDILPALAIQDKLRLHQIATSVPGDAMENCTIKVEPEEQVEAMENRTIKVEPEKEEQVEAMENWTIKVEPEEQVDAMENAEPAERDWIKPEVEDGLFESVMIKLEPEVDVRESKSELLGSCIDIEEHSVKLEQSDALICGLPAPDTEIWDQEQPRDFGKLISFRQLLVIFVD